MKFFSSLAIIVAVSVLAAQSANACSSGTAAQRKRWAVERQQTLDRSFQVAGYFKELSRAEFPSTSPQSLSLQDSGAPAIFEVPHTIVIGLIVNRRGKLLHKVQFTLWHDLGVCRWTKHPSDSEYGDFYLE
jgi:hypothetical protein